WAAGETNGSRPAGDSVGACPGAGRAAGVVCAPQGSLDAFAIVRREGQAGGPLAGLMPCPDPSPRRAAETDLAPEPPAGRAPELVGVDHQTFPHRLLPVE